MWRKLITLLRDKKIPYPCCVALRRVTLRCGTVRGCAVRQSSFYHDSTHRRLVLGANNHGERPRPTVRNEKQNT